MFCAVGLPFFAEKYNPMKKQELIADFIKNHEELIRYVDRLDDFEFSYSYNNKWTAGQQLEHVLRTIMPFPKVLPSKEFILEKFGKINRSTWDYKTVLENYSKTSLKAPEQFLPKDDIPIIQKNEIISDIRTILRKTAGLLDTYSEDELDTLTLPHPLLGTLTIREMFYLMSYHPLHHQKQIEKMLEDHFR